MEETNLETDIIPTENIENTYIYNFDELLEEVRLLREDLILAQEQQEIFQYENLNFFQENNLKLNSISTTLMFLLITFLIFSGICIGYILGKRD